eukprot:Tbor_TRINITY_DN5005_c0_g1::TRINITY_DN5005_c0_g1_i1::g.14056::m.14056
MSLCSSDQRTPSCDDLVRGIQDLVYHTRIERESDIVNNNTSDDFQVIHKIRSLTETLYRFLSECEISMVSSGSQAKHTILLQLKELISDHRFVFGLLELMLLKSGNGTNDNHLFPIFWHRLIININFAEVPSSPEVLKQSCKSTDNEKEEALFHLHKVITILFRNAIIDCDYGSLMAAAVESSGRRAFGSKCKDDIRDIICRRYNNNTEYNSSTTGQKEANEWNSEGNTGDNHNINSYFTDDVSQQIPFYIVSAALVGALATFPLPSSISDFHNRQSVITPTYHPSVPQLGQLLRILIVVKPFCQAMCSLLPQQLIDIFLMEHYSCNMGSGASEILCDIFNNSSLLPLTSHPFRSFCVVGMMLECASSTVSTCQAAEAWSCVGSLFMESKSMVAACLLANFEEFVQSVIEKLGVELDGSASQSDGELKHCQSRYSPPLYVRRRQLLKLLSIALGDPAYKKARTRLADCPALFVAVLRVVETLPNPLEEKISRYRRIQRHNQQLNRHRQQDRRPISTGDRKYSPGPQQLTSSIYSPLAVVDLFMGNAGLKGANGLTDEEDDAFFLSSGNQTGFNDAMLLYDCYHVLKVILAKPKKNLCIQHIVSSNRDALMTFVQHYHESRTAAAQLIEMNNAGFLMGRMGEGGLYTGMASLASQEAKMCEEEKKLIISQVAKVAPLSAEELLTLRHFIGHHPT